MKRFFLLALLSLLCTPTRAEAPVEFQNDIIPVLTKHGCNAGACHGAAIGRGGFKLSLYGGNPDADYNAIVRKMRGRRVNLSEPDLSLVIRKPTEIVEHGGGAVFGTDSESTERLTAWIRQGATAESSRELLRVEVTPEQQIGQSLNVPIDLQAIAHYSDGSSRDVTRWTIFTAEDSSAVTIEMAEDTTAHVQRRGRHLVIARFLSEVVPVELIVSHAETSVEIASQSPRNFIDVEVLQSLKTLGLPPSPIADEATVLRRLSLDLTGRLPSPNLIEQIAGGDMPRESLIDYLVQSDQFSQNWTYQLAKLFRVRPQGQDDRGAFVYYDWLAKQVAEDTSYRQLARTLILALGDSQQYGPANFYRTVRTPREQAEFASEVFMGSRLRCANCHNHPLDRWTQDDYHGLAAIFAKVEQDAIVKLKPHGTVIHPRTLEPALERIPGGEFIEPGAPNGREQLADWLIASENPYFAKAIVNRLWQHMFGRGLVEPVDDFRATNPATHPALLAKLADDFIANDYSIRHTLRRIAESQTYARSANAVSQNKDDDRFYSHQKRRALEAEVLADAITDVLGLAEEYGEKPMGTRAVTLVNPKLSSTTLDVLGRCGREDSCEGSSDAIGGLPQNLHLFNGPLLNARIAADGSRLRRLLDKGTPPATIVEQFYLLALNRQPTATEKQGWDKQLGAADNKAEFLEDFVWGLLTCSEFVTNH